MKKLKRKNKSLEERLGYALKKFQTSKVLAFYSLALYTTVVLFTLYEVDNVGDLSPLNILIPTTAGFVTTSVGFYFNKAKAENLIKEAQRLKVKGITEEDIKRAKLIVQDAFDESTPQG